MKKLQHVLALFALAFLSFTAQGQTAIVNYDFNSGGSYTALAPIRATNITSTATGTEAFTTFAGTTATTGQGAFTANSTSGQALAMNNSSGTTKYFQFQLGGSALASYGSYEIFLQAQRSGTGATTITLQYSTNGTSWATAGTGSPGNGSFSVITFDLSTGAAATALDNKTAVYFRLVASGASSTGTLRIDNFQVGATAVVAPTVSTTTASGITATTAASGGNVSSQGSSALNAKGVVWTTSSTVDPTISSSKTTITGTATGSFTSTMTSLLPNTTYYYRAYATNTDGATGYGNKLSFTTLVLPTVTTASSTNVTSSSATTGGNVTVQGTTAVTARGVVWSTSQNPTITTNLGITTDGTGTGSFVSEITGLALNTTYYYRAYATNDQGTSYGAQSSFQTLSILAPTVTTTAFSAQNDATTATGFLKGSITNNGGAAITQRGFVWNTTDTTLTAGQANTIINTDTADTDAAFSDTAEGLLPNTQYFYRAFATNSTGTGYGGTNNFYTHAATPGAPAISNATTTSLTVTADVNGNPVATQYLIRVLVGSNPYYINQYSALQSTPEWLAGSFVANPITITGLTAGTNYTFDVKARNVSLIETPWGSTTTQATVSPTTPYFTLVSTNLEYGNVCINTTANGQFVLSATNLAIGQYITIYDLAGFTYSLTENGTYQNALLFPNPGGNITVYVRFAPTQVQDYPAETDGIPGTINISAANTGTLNVPLSGKGVNTPATAATGTATDIAITSVTIAGQAIKGCPAITAYGIEYSTTTGFANGTGTQAASNNIAATDFTSAITGLSACTPYYYKAYVTDAIGTHYGEQQTFTTLPLAGEPVAVAAGNITQTDFTANWGAVAGATGYYLDVSPSPDFETVILNEDFADVSMPAGDTEITAVLANYGLTGWTGIRIYGETGLIRIGTSGILGNVTTPTVNLSVNSGSSTLTFKAKHIGGSDAGKSIRVMHAANGTTFTQVGSPIVLPAAFETFTVQITGGTASSKIRIEGVGPVPNRFNIDDLKIAYAQSLVGYSNLQVTGTSQAITGLNPDTNYYYRVRAHGGNCTSANSNTIEVETLSYLTLTASDLVFGNVCTNATETGSFTLTGSGLTDATLNVGAQAGYAYSLAEDGPYTSTLPLTNYNGAETTVYVQFAPQSVQSYNGNITVTGAATYTAAQLAIPVTGAGIFTPAVAVASAATGITMVSATLPGTSTDGNCSATLSYGMEYSTTNNFVTGTGIKVPSTTIENTAYTVLLEGLTPCTPYYYRAYTETADGFIHSAQRNFTTTSPAAPVAIAATDANESGFTANWNTVENATGYRLDIATNPAFETASVGATTTETFSNIPASASSYAARTWTGDNGIDWSATDASTNQTLDGRAILLRTGSLTNTSIISGGVSKLSFDYQRAFTTGNPILRVFINGQQYGGDITVTASVQTFTLENLNITGSIDLELRNTGGSSARTIIDNLEIKRLDVNNQYYVAGYKDLDVENVTSIPVTGLVEFGTYYYRVRAYTANCTTANSNTIIARTKGTVTWKISGGQASWMPQFYADGTTPVVIDTDTPVRIETAYNTAANGVFTAKSITLAAGTFTIASGTSLTVENEIINNLAATAFVVENNGNLLQNNEMNTLNSDAITVYRNSAPLLRQDYTIWSAPVSGQNIFNFSPNTLAARFYNYSSATDQYAPIPGGAAAATFQLGHGYLIRMPNGGVDANGVPTGTTASPAGYQQGTETMVFNGKFTGVPNNGAISVPLSADGNGFNMIGNPYPSPIDVTEFLTINQNVIDGTVWLWRKTNASTNTAYCTINRAGQYIDNDEPNTEADPNGVIRTGQGFIVQLAQTPQSTSVAFNNTMRSDDTSNQFFRNAGGQGRPESHGIYLNLTNANGFFSQSYTGYIEGATAGFDNGIDSKYINDNPTVLSTVIDGSEYIIHGRALPFNSQNTEPLQLRVAAAGMYSIAIGRLEGLFTQGQQVFIKDNLTGVTHNLTQGVYTFANEAGTFTNRLEIVYADGTLGTDKPVLDTNNVVIYKQDNSIMISTGTTEIQSVTVFDMRGRMLYNSNNINSAEHSVANLQIAQQVLIVQIETKDKGTVSRKILF